MTDHKTNVGPDDKIEDTTIIYIRWKDHYGKDQWTHWKEFQESEPYILIHTVGYLIGEDDESYKIASNISEEGYVNATTVVLKSCVVEKTECHLK